MVFFRDIGVGRHDLTPQNSTLLLRVKSVVRLDLTQKSSFLDGHYLYIIHVKLHKSDKVAFHKFAKRIYLGNQNFSKIYPIFFHTVPNRYSVNAENSCRFRFVSPAHSQRFDKGFFF